VTKNPVLLAKMSNRQDSKDSQSRRFSMTDRKYVPVWYVTGRLNQGNYDRIQKTGQTAQTNQAGLETEL